VKPSRSWAGLLIVMGGIPVYALLLKDSRRAE
jgi:hypothetical protein